MLLPLEMDSLIPQVQVQLPAGILLWTSAFILVI